MRTILRMIFDLCKTLNHRKPSSIKRYLFHLVVFVTAAFSGYAQSVIAPWATLQKMAGGFAFTEGPTCDKDGNLFFVDQPNNRIMEWSVDGKLSTFMQPSGHSNGMMFDANGNLISCADEHNELWSIAPDKTVTVLVTNYEGKYLNGPNDVWITPSGGIYMTDPFYRRTWWDHRNSDLDGQKTYYLTPDRKNLFPVTEAMGHPNGITGTPDGKTLYVSALSDGQTWRYDILPDGSLTNKALFCERGSDGMTIDENGDLIMCAGPGPTNGVSIFNPAGKLIGHIDVPEPWSANVAFAGKDHKTLFITASKSLYSIQMSVRGWNATK
jgi:gluconolactonase